MQKETQQDSLFLSDDIRDDPHLLHFHPLLFAVDAAAKKEKG